MSIRRETKDEDEARTGALLDALDQATDAGDQEAPLTAFEEVVLDGLACGPACSGAPYPPAGHSFPRRG
jgi:hypothetical protein